MPKVPGINHLSAIRAFEKAGYEVARQSGHIVMKRGLSLIVIPRANPIKPHTMGAIIRSAGLTVEEFRELLK
ncbi:MAG: type II toxin-antitoxin system HicA family toxin [Fimbriimonadaceae bacterium]